MVIAELYYYTEVAISNIQTNDIIIRLLCDTRVKKKKTNEPYIYRLMSNIIL